jgi:hypothetical protein
LRQKKGQQDSQIHRGDRGSRHNARQLETMGLNFDPLLISFLMTLMLQLIQAIELPFISTEIKRETRPVTS